MSGGDRTEIVEACREAGSSLVGRAMRNADLSGITLDGVEIRSCRAMEAVFRKASLVDVSFLETALGNADFEEAEMVGVLFSASDLYAARFSDAVIVRTRFENRRLGNAVLSQSDFSGAVILDCDFSSADLAGASFRGALLVRTSFKDANVNGVDFTGALLVSSDFTRMNADEGTRDVIMKNSVRPRNVRSRLLEHLEARKGDMVSLAHSLLVGYVLTDTPGTNTNGDTPQEPPETEGTPGPAPEKAPTPLPETGDGRAAAGSDAPVPDNSGVTKESEQVYERFKKIEMD